MPNKKNSRSDALGYALILPSLAFLALVYLYPLARLIPMSASRPVGREAVFVGFDNFIYLLKDAIIHRAVLNNLTLLLGIPIVIFLSFVLSVVLFDTSHGSKLIQSIIFFPYLLSTVVSSIMFGVLLQYNGVLNTALRELGLGIAALDWFGSTRVAIFTVIGVMVWREVGFGTLLFLAQLTMLPQEVFDAARVDGASWLQKVVYVTMPQMKGLVLFYFAYLVIIFTSWSFNYIYILTSGGPGFSTIVLDFSIFHYAITKRLPHVAAALSLLLFVSILGFVYLQFRMRKEQLGGGQS